MSVSDQYAHDLATTFEMKITHRCHMSREKKKREKSYFDVFSKVKMSVNEMDFLRLGNSAFAMRSTREYNYNAREERCGGGKKNLISERRACPGAVNVRVRGRGRVVGSSSALRDRQDNFELLHVFECDNCNVDRSHTIV